MARSLWIAGLAVVILFGRPPASARAGEVAGRIVFTRAIKAGVGAAPGILSGPARDEALAAGPVLIYVAEAEAELPRTSTAGARMRLAGGKVTPRLVAVSLGSIVTFENADRREHRLRSRAGPMRFDLGWQPSGATRELRAEQTGIVPIECALHEDMRGEIVILAHAAFAIADAGGDYHLRDLPPGRATIVAYAPQLGEVSREIVVAESETVEVDFAF